MACDSVHMYKQTCDYVCTCCVQGVFNIDKEKGLILVEISKGVTIKKATGCLFEVSYYTL